MTGGMENTQIPHNNSKNDQKKVMTASTEKEDPTK